jgi:hypothetical protein
VHDLDVVGGKAELFGDDLGEGRLVPLALVCTEIRSTALPVGWIRSSTPSAMPKPRMSMCFLGPAPTASVKKLIPMPMR